MPAETCQKGKPPPLGSCATRKSVAPNERTAKTSRMITRVTSQMFRSVADNPKYKSIDAVIDDLNSTSETRPDRETLVCIISTSCDFFAEMADTSVDNDIIDSFLSISKLKPKTDKEFKNMHKYFDILFEKIRDDHFGREKYHMAVEVSMATVDPFIFKPRVVDLLALANCLLEKIDVTKTILTEDTARSHSSVLTTLFRVFLILKHVAPNSLNKDTEPYPTFKKKLEELEKHQECFDLLYLIKLLLQSVRELESAKPSIGDVAKRLFHGVKAAHMLPNIILSFLTPSTSMEDANDFIDAVKVTVKSNAIAEGKWYQFAATLFKVTEDTIKDDNKYDGLFKMTIDQYLEWIKEPNIWDEKTNDRELLLYTIVRQLAFMASNSQNPQVQSKAAEELLKISANWKLKQETIPFTRSFIKVLLELNDCGYCKSTVKEALVNLHKRFRKREQKIFDDLFPNDTLEQRLEKEDDSLRSHRGTGLSSGDDKLFLNAMKELGLAKTTDADNDIKTTYLKNYYLEAEFTLIACCHEGLDTHHSLWDVDYEIRSVMLKGVDEEEKETDAAGNPVLYNLKHILDGSIFNKSSGGSGSVNEKHKAVYVVGRPGTGKTCLSKRLANKWAASLSKKSVFSALYVLPIDQVNRETCGQCRRYDLSLESIVADMCINRRHLRSVERGNKLHRQIDADLGSTQTLLIVDGVDNTGHMGIDFLDDIKDKACHVLYLGRQCSADKAVHLAYDKEYYLNGFVKDTPEEFITKDVQDDPDNVKRLVDYAKSNEERWRELHHPATIRFLCNHWIERTKTNDVDLEDGLWEQVQTSKKQQYCSEKRFSDNTELYN